MKYILIILLSIQIASAQSIKAGMTSDQVKREQAKIKKQLGKYPAMFVHWRSESERAVVLERVSVSPSQNRISLYMNATLGHIAAREQRIKQWEQMVRDTMGKGYENCRVQFYSKGIPVERLVPNVYRSTLTRDAARAIKPIITTPLVQRLDQPLFGKGLSYRHIAIWASHGRYFDEVTGTWRWQRPALFGSVEDLNTFEWLDHFLIPMLENAGATLISPRERDTQTQEIIVGIKDAKVELSKHNWKTRPLGFRQFASLVNQNPFLEGEHLETSTTRANPASVTYRLEAKRGEYALYVAYNPLPTNLLNTKYIVNHLGGVTTYEVNQRIGGGWLYLGKHSFDENSSVQLIGIGEGTLTADAIRLGGGMGNVSRKGTVSGLPRWAEGARYSMQYNGVPEAIYDQDTPGKADYTDDYKSRGDWCNYIKNDLHIPLDAALALHTNAGINDSIFGTLTINYTNQGRAIYPNGKSSFAGRDLADIILTQITDDIHRKYTRRWTRRSLYDRGYAEVSRPELPAVIIELLSHQNFEDMKLALDPAFRFDAARAIYKGLLKFLADRYSIAYQVQPLAVQQFSMNTKGDMLRLEWQPTADSLEPTATTQYYKLYTRLDDADFDNGTIVRTNNIELPIQCDGRIRSYRVTALNEGGESFPSETLSSGFLSNRAARMALVVNGFTRLSAPDTTAGGFDFVRDPGVPYIHDRGVVGTQIDFDRSSPYLDNDMPGWGRSSEELATMGRPGNKFDYTAIHGRALLKAGYNYISRSRAAFEKEPQPRGFALIDIIMGEQRASSPKYTIFSDAIRDKINAAIGVKVIVSGLYLNTELDQALKSKIIAIPYPLEKRSTDEIMVIFSK